MTRDKKNAPEAGQGFEGNNRNPQQKEPIDMNATAIIPGATDTHNTSRWEDSRVPEIEVPCDQPGCRHYGDRTGHIVAEVDGPDGFMHIAHAASGNDWTLDVFCLGGEAHWEVGGKLDDDSTALTPEKVRAFMDAWKGAQRIADHLNTLGGAR